MTAIETPATALQSATTKIAEKRAKALREQIVVPHWPRKASIAERIGMGDDLPVPGCDAVWIHLRTREDAYGDLRMMGNVGVYVWFSSLRKFQIEVKAHHVHSATARELESILKIVKSLGKKVPAQMREGQDQDQWESLPMYLPRLLQAFGVTQCVQYGIGIPGEDRFAPIYLYLEDLNKDIQRRITRMARTPG